MAAGATRVTGVGTRRVRATASTTGTRTVAGGRAASRGHSATTAGPATSTGVSGRRTRPGAVQGVARQGGAGRVSDGAVSSPVAVGRAVGVPRPRGPASPRAAGHVRRGHGVRGVSGPTPVSRRVSDAPSTAIALAVETRGGGTPAAVSKTVGMADAGLLGGPDGTVFPEGRRRPSPVSGARLYVLSVNGQVTSNAVWSKATTISYYV